MEPQSQKAAGPSSGACDIVLTIVLAETYSPLNRGHCKHHKEAKSKLTHSFKNTLRVTVYFSKTWIKNRAKSLILKERTEGV